MEYKLHEILEAYEVINRWKKMPMAATPAYRLGRMEAKMASEVKLFESKRLELIQKYGKEDEKKKGVFSVDPKNVEAMDAITKDLNAIVEETVNLDVFSITLDMLGDLKVTPEEVNKMNKFIVEPLAIAKSQTAPKAPVVPIKG